MKPEQNVRRFRVYVILSGILAASAFHGLGCGGTPAGSTGSTTDGTTDSGGDDGSVTTGDDNVLLNEALGYEGSVSGKVYDSQTTRRSIEETSSDDASASQVLPPAFDTAAAMVRFKDLAGSDLLDADGQPFTGVPVESDGSFRADNLPVGVDFTACVDIDSDGRCDIESSVNIPSRDGGDEGELTGVRADPLSTLVLSKLRDLIDRQGIDAQDLPISPIAVATRIDNAYTHLFEDSGIDQTVRLDDIESVSREELAAMFDSIIPAAARSGMQIVEGNLAVARAADAEAMALAAAEVFLRAGFPIADRPEPPDLSALARLDGVTTTTPDEFFADQQHADEPEGGLPDGPTDGFPDGLPQDPMDELEGGFPDGFPDDDPDGLVDTPFVGVADTGGSRPPSGPQEIIYVSDVTEPDRNFANADEGPKEEDSPPLPMLNDHILLEMARHHLDGRRITLGELHEVLTSLDDGLGARLMYPVHDPNFFGPPLMVFETADGSGEAIDIDGIMRRLFDEGFHELDPEAFERREAELRATLAEILGNTIPPTFERLFGAIFSERIPDAAELARRIRDAKSHLPFSRSGPSSFFVVADGDPFMSDQPVSALTVDAEVTMDGDVRSVTYNENGNGAYHLGFTEGTEDGGFVELIVRETGRFLHGRRGPVRISIFDETVFQPINGQPFADFVSESGIFYPGTHISVMNDGYVPEAREEGPGPDQQLFVLATGVGEGAEPVRVDYDSTTGIATYNPGGRHLLMFHEDSHETGLFALFNEDTGREAGRQDPTNFFEGPHERPEDFEHMFNEVDDFDHFANVDEFLEHPFGEFPEDGQFPPPPDGDMPWPPDGEMWPPPDGDMPPDGEMWPPPDGDMPPFPDGEMWPPPDDDGAPPPEGEMWPPPDGEEPPPGGEEPPPGGEEPPPGGEGPPPGDQPPPGDEPVPPAQFNGEDTGSDSSNAPPPGDANSTSPGEPSDQPPPPQPDDYVMGTDEPPYGDGGNWGDPPPEGDGHWGEPPHDGGGMYGEPPHDGFHEPEFIWVAASEVVGLEMERTNFRHVFGTDVPNERHDPAGDPYYDDLNGNGVEDENEPTAPHRPTLFDSNDWRSTDIRMYYRRADNDQAITFEEVDWEADTPLTLDGVALVPRNYVPRLNAYRFGRPNLAINVLTAFTPPEFFDGTHALDRTTSVDVFSAVAMINLVMEQVFNVEADVDIDGIGPMPRQQILMDAHMFVAPLDDPFLLLLEGFRDRSSVRNEGR